MNKANQEDNELLKSCPFCGEEPRLHSGYESGIRLCGCKNWDCEIAGKMFNIDWWNIRPQSTDGDEVEKLFGEYEVIFDKDDENWVRESKYLELLNYAKSRSNDEVGRLREALENISLTAQMASMHEPEQFCEWAYNFAQQALSIPNKGGSV